MDRELPSLWQDDELIELAQRRLSITVLTNHFPIAAARLFLDAIEKQMLADRLHDVERIALRYYRLYLDIQEQPYPGGSIGNVSAIFALKREIQKEDKLSDNWKITLIDELADPFAMRDSLAQLYFRAKQNRATKPQ